LFWAEELSFGDVCLSFGIPGEVLSPAIAEVGIWEESLRSGFELAIGENCKIERSVVPGGVVGGDTVEASRLICWNREISDLGFVNHVYELGGHFVAAGVLHLGVVSGNRSELSSTSPDVSVHDVVIIRDGNGRDGHEEIAPRPTMHSVFSQVAEIGSEAGFLGGEVSVAADGLVNLIAVESDDVGLVRGDILDEPGVWEPGGIIARKGGDFDGVLSGRNGADVTVSIFSVKLNEKR